MASYNKKQKANRYSAYEVDLKIKRVVYYNSRQRNKAKKELRMELETYQNED